VRGDRECGYSGSWVRGDEGKGQRTQGERISIMIGEGERERRGRESTGTDDITLDDNTT
jgi:hypothetical protein